VSFVETQKFVLSLNPGELDPMAKTDLQRMSTGIKTGSKAKLTDQLPIIAELEQEQKHYNNAEAWIETCCCLFAFLLDKTCHPTVAPVTTEGVGI